MTDLEEAILYIESPKYPKHFWSVYLPRALSRALTRVSKETNTKSRNELIVLQLLANKQIRRAFIEEIKAGEPKK